jgi:hypothetical protein
LHSTIATSRRQIIDQIASVPLHIVPRLRTMQLTIRIEMTAHRFTTAPRVAILVNVKRM